ncbi:Na+/H+ antiporter NhaC [Anaerotruncus rubiinfantis]|uniref:Na+/H+ antiporter NhaC n=1 Tax=Anaerotruncus rubiinfantis TaxID=1720200 RepID=UPI0034A37956
MTKSVEPMKMPSLWLSAGIIVMIGTVLTTGITAGIATIPLLTLNIVLVAVVSLLSGYPYRELEQGMMEGVRRSIDCVMILIFVGVLIAGWILCGTVPMLIYYGLSVVSPKLLLPLAFLLCSLLSLCTGSSWGTAGTVGIACVSIGASIGIPVAVVAGAAISGSILGDKLSPLSDATIMAASASGTGLYQHVRSMAYTTAPSFLITLLIFYFMGAAYADTPMHPAVVETVRGTLAEIYQFSPLLLLPMAAILVFSLMRMPAIPAILLSGLLGLFLAVAIQGVDVSTAISAILQGAASNTGVEIVDSMLNKGGITAMLSTLCTAVLALGLGGILSRAGYLHVLVEAISRRVKTDRGTVILTLFCGMITLCLVAQFYVSVALMGTMFGEIYDARRIHRSVLSRTLEESNTIMLPLVPWNTSAVYYMGLFGFHNLAFAPYLVFSYVNIAICLLCVLSGLFIFRRRADNPAETDWKWHEPVSDSAFAQEA